MISGAAGSSSVAGMAARGGVRLQPLSKSVSRHVTLLIYLSARGQLPYLSAETGTGVGDKLLATLFDTRML